MDKQRYRRRSACGQGIAECAVSAWLISAVIVFMICLMTFIAAFMQKRMQLEHVAQQAAKFGINRVYYAGLPKGLTDAQAEMETSKVIKPILDEMGFTSTTLLFKTKLIGKLHYGEVLLSADTVPLKGAGIPILSAILPVEVTIVDSALAVESNAVPPYVTAITMQGGTPARIYVPAVAGGDWKGGPENPWPASLSVPLAGPPAPGYGLITSNGIAAARVNHDPGTPSPAGEY